MSRLKLRVLHTPQRPSEASNFMNIRVADIWASYYEWQSRGDELITEPRDHGLEIRSYMRGSMGVSSRSDKQPVV